MKRILLIVLGLLLVGVGYTYWNYYNSFSDGYREGMLYKFSRKGNFFKTYEGEIIQPGLRSISAGCINTNNFCFSVTDQKIADSLEANIGKNVKLHYTQYRKSLPWRGDNYNGKNIETGQYIIDRIESIREVNPNQQQIGF